MEQDSFTHVQDGQPTMVDITGKASNRRTAVAETKMALGMEIISRLEGCDLNGPKGPVFQTAIIAGTMAVKKTSELIPFCHPLPVEACDFQILPEQDGIVIRCSVSTSGKTGVEMEAITGSTVAALTIYDMCKALNKAIVIRETRLISKTGGKSGDYHYKEP